MAFGSFHAKPATAPMAEINVIPLVDIMLVLLVIFIITAPLLTHAVKIDLPQAQSAPIEQPAERVELAIDGEGLSYWNGERLADEAALVERLAAAGRQSMPPELHLRVDRSTRYERVAAVMSAAGRAGLSRIGFVTDPGGAALPVAPP